MKSFYERVHQHCISSFLLGSSLGEMSDTCSGRDVPMGYCEGDFHKITHIICYIFNNALMRPGIIRAKISCSIKSSPIYVELMRNDTSKILIFVLHPQIGISLTSFLRIIFYRLDENDKIFDLIYT